MEEKDKKITLSLNKTIIIIVGIVILIAIICLIVFLPKTKDSSISSGKQKNNSSIESGSEKENSSIQNDSNKNNSTKKTKQVVLYDTVTVNDYCEIQIKSHKFANTIEPPTPTGYYHYYAASSNEYTYFDLQLDIKNIQNNAVKQDSLVSAKLVYDGKYEYNCFQVTEESGGGDFETFPNLYSIDPLKTLKYHFLVEVPTDVRDNESKSLSVIIKSKGEEFEYKIR